MVAQEPLVSIVVTTYNRAKLLSARSLASIKRQTFSDWDCVVIDDGSTDDTEAVVMALAKEDPRFSYFKKQQGGPASARNFGIRKTHGKFIAFIDDDDEFMPTFLEVALATFTERPEISYLSSHAINRDEHGVETYSAYAVDPVWEYSIGNMFVFKREVFFERDLFFDESLVFGEDLDLHIRFYLDGQKGYVIPEPLRIYNVALEPAKRAGGQTSGARMQGDTFEKFFIKNEENYRKFGRDALAWLYLTGGLLVGRVGKMRQARRFFRKSLRAKFTMRALAGFIAACFGQRFFVEYYKTKTKIMRVVRSRILNRV
jgi:glycosyltransferase involved in cell wall biosynthesis